MAIIKRDEIYTVTITGMNHDGQGVGRIEGMAVFVDGALSGEICEIKILTSKKSYATAELIKIIKKSENRIETFCKHFVNCGGCSLQHMNYDAQLLMKADIVKDSLQRIGKIENVKVNQTIGMDSPFYYRNKAQFPIGIEAGKPVCGFYSRRSHDICNILSCGIQDAVSIAVNEAVKEFISKYKVRVYEEKKRTGLLRHVITRVGFKTGEVMVVIVINGDDLPYKDELVVMIKEKVDGIGLTKVDGISVVNDGAMQSGDKQKAGDGKFEQLRSEKAVLKSVFLNINTRNTNIILGEKSKKIFGEDKITDFIGKYKFEISPLSFFQVNPVQTEVMYNKVLDYAGLTGNETVFDIYCGAGTISLFLSEKAKKVYGIEVVPEAVHDALKNAEINGIKNVEFIEGDAETVIPALKAKGIIPDVVVVDPPRKGCDESILETIAQMGPKRIIYVSCNPSTLARDLRYLEDNGYKTKEAQPIDMFPWTPHVECVVRIERK
ncbi:MAG: 23S rRNA (uracil(1939)-C(5))-methyltransferase RlmD [Clostridia bacterium]|jgi:23S rRNA (uracil1939-C5)-methyltransferase